MFSQTALPNQTKVDPRTVNKASSIQYGYRKGETHARAFWTFAQDSKIKIRKRNRGRRQTEKNENGKKYNGHEKKKSDVLTVARAYRSNSIKEKKIIFFIQIKNIWYYNVYIHKLKLSINYFD